MFSMFCKENFGQSSRMSSFNECSNGREHSDGIFNKVNDLNVSGNIEIERSSIEGAFK